MKLFYSVTPLFVRKFILLFSFTLAIHFATGQVNVAWYNYPGGVSVATNNSYDVYTVNWDYNPAGDITLTKRDSAGTVLWDTAYDNVDMTRHEMATWVETDHTGNILVSGTIRSGFSSPVNAASLLMKFDSSGALLWRVVYESSFEGSSTKKLLIDANDNIYVLGLGMGSNGLVTKVKKFEPSGVPVWSYYDTAGIGYPFNIKFTPDSCLLLIAKTTTGNLNGFSKIDTSGNTIWNRTGVNSASIGDAAGDSSGYTYLINGDNMLINPRSVLRKLSSAGAELWSDTCSITGFRVEVGSDEYPVICGFPNSGTPGAAFIKYDDSGTIIWQNLDADGPGYALLLHAQMKMDADNAAYLAAGTMSEMALCKVNSNGTSAWTAVMPGSYANSFAFMTNDVIYVTGGTTAKLGQSTTMGGNDLETASQKLKAIAYPNPFFDATTLELELKEALPVIITIQDITGRIVKTMIREIHDSGIHKIAIETSGLNSGVYFCMLNQDGINKVTLKLIRY